MSEEKIEYLPLDPIELAPQVRTEFSEESLRRLADTMSNLGQLQPIRVRREGDVYVVVAGERRLRAARMSGRLTTIAAIVESGELNAADVVQRQLVENLQKEDLKPLETAQGIRELMKHTGKSGAEVASMLGLACGTVSKLLSLLELPESIRAQVSSGEIPVTAAYQLSRVADAGEQALLAQKLAQGLSRDGLSAIVKQSRSRDGGDKPARPVRVRVELNGGRSITAAGVGLTDVDTLIQWLEELLGKVRKLRPKGLGLRTIVRLLNEASKK